MADEKESQRERAGEHRRRKAAEEDGRRGDQAQFQKDEEPRLEHRRADRVVGRAQHRCEGRHHDEHVDRQHDEEACEPADEEAGTRNRLRERGKHGLALDFAGDEADADEDRDQRSGQLDGGESHVEYDPVPLADGELGDVHRAPDQQHREEEQVVEELVVHQLADGVAGDDAYRAEEFAHRTTSRPAVV